MVHSGLIENYHGRVGNFPGVFAACTWKLAIVGKEINGLLVGGQRRRGGRTGLQALKRFQPFELGTSGRAV